MDEYFQSLSPAQQQKFLEGPGLTPPNGKFDLDNPPNENSIGYAVVTVCLVVSALQFFLRLYARAFYLKKLSAPDYLMIAGFVTFASFCGLCYRMISFIGFNVHQWNVQAKHLIDFGYVVFVGVNMYNMTLMCLKVSILLDWLHIFVPHGKRNKFYWTSQAVIWLNILWYCAGVIRLNLLCSPHSKIWDFTIPEGQCHDDGNWWTATASVNLASDIVILLLPQTTIWNLQLSRAKKIGVSVVFAMGLLVCAASSWRLTASMDYVAAEDATYAICPVILGSCIEILCIFAVLCVPSVPLIVSRSELLSGIVASLKTWRSSSGSGWKTSATPSTMKSDTGTYRNIDHQMSLPLEHIPTSTESTSGSAKNLIDAENGQAGQILRTTQVMSYDTYLPSKPDEVKQKGYEFGDV